MSLTTFLKNPDVRKRFAEQFPRQPIPRKSVSPIPPLTSHVGLVGTAFDYLLRFHVKQLNPKAKTRPWVAEAVPAAFQAQVQRSKDRYDLNRWTTSRRNSRLDAAYVEYRRRLTSKARRIVREAEVVYAQYLQKGVVDRRLLRSVLLLAQLDPFFRSGQDEYDLGFIDQLDINDLAVLIGLVDPRMFKAKKVCALNPTFGAGSRLVGGADADLIIDDMLVDVKTTKYLRVKRDHWNQLIGYYILAAIGGVDGLSPKYRIRRLGIYFSRFGELLTFDAEEAIGQKGFRPFVRWFIERAQEECFRQSY